MYRFDSGSPLLLIDMMESTTLWIGVYLRKNRRENGYSSELTTPPSLEDRHQSRRMAAWKMKAKVEEDLPAGLRLANAPS